MNRKARDGDYRAARIGTASALTLMLAIIVLSDAFQPQYDPPPIVLIVLAGLIAALLAVDLPEWIGRGK